MQYAFKLNKKRLEVTFLTPEKERKKKVKQKKYLKTNKEEKINVD